MPRLHDDHGLNTSFAQQFEEFFSTNFGLRTWLITADALLTDALLRQSNNRQVVVGREGWLFFEETVDDYLRRNVLSPGDLVRLGRILALQQEYLAEQDIVFVFTVAPNKNTIYGDQMPERYWPLPNPSNLENLESVLRDLGVAYVDLAEALLQARERVSIYHRDDTHWNNYGALKAVQSVMAEVEARVPGFIRPSFPTEYDPQQIWRGDLAAMLFPAVDRLDWQLEYDLDQTYELSRPMRSPEDMNIISTSGYGDTRLLIFRDSFCNAWIPFLSRSFSYAHYVRAVPHDYRLLATDEPDVVILEVAERNLPDLLNHAPIMPAPRRSVLAAGAVVDESLTVTIRRDTVEPYLRLRGSVTLPRYDPEAADVPLVYLRFLGDTQDSVFLPFPVLDDELARESAENETVPLGFSLLLSPDSLPTGEYQVEILLQDDSTLTRSRPVLHLSLP